MRLIQKYDKSINNDLININTDKGRTNHMSETTWPPYKTNISFLLESLRSAGLCWKETNDDLINLLKANVQSQG